MNPAEQKISKRDQTYPGASDQARLRATLRLCFAPEQADALAARAVRDEADPVRALAPVVQLARLNYTSGRGLAPFKPTRRSAACTMPLRPRLGVPALPALVLALHLGLNLDIDTLATLFGRSPSTIAAALQQARRAVDPDLVPPCAGFVEPIGRYRDPVVDRLDERLTFMQHLATCKRCRVALDRARQIDDRLLATIARTERDLPKTAELKISRRAVWLGPALLWGSVALFAVALVLAGIAGSRRLLAHEQAPVPLRSTSAANPALSGWLIQTSQSGDVDAINLATSAQRRLISSQPASNNAETSVTTLLSPNHQIIVQTATGSNVDVLLARAYTLNGTLLHEWNPLNQDGVGDVLGWLNDDELLLTDVPEETAGEAPEEYHSRLANQGELVALNVRGDTRKVIARGWIFSAFVSPDRQHIAIYGATGDGTPSFEIRALNGDQPGALEASATTTPFLLPLQSNPWTPDSQHLVFMVPTQAASQPGEVFQAMALDGRLTEIARLPANTSGNLVGISPDGRNLIYTLTGSSFGVSPWSYWQVSFDGGEPQKLAESTSAVYQFSGTSVWSPSGDVLALTVGQPFYLPHPQPEGTSTTITAFSTLAYDTAGRPLGPLFDQFSNQTSLAWLPEDALTMTPGITATTGGSFHTAGPLTDDGTTTQLTGDSQISLDGAEALVYAPTYDASLTVKLSDKLIPQIAGTKLDPSLLPDESGAISIEQRTVSGGHTSQITIRGQTTAGDLAPIDFDPAQLGSSTTEAYRYPMLAPNGLHYSFFVVGSHAVALWVGGQDEPPRAIANWTLPPDAGSDLPLIASWVSDDTLIFTEPDAWRDGLPQQVTLRRVTVAANGTTTSNPLISWEPHGNERGIVPQELQLSADQTQLAVRLRHVTRTNPSTSTFDSIEVASTSNLRQSFELARGASGDGLNWSPGGTELAAVIKGELDIFTVRGGQIEQVDTGGRSVSYPLWVHPNEIWYESGNDNGGQMLRATR